MKSLIFSFTLIFCIANISMAQDSLTMKSGAIIQVKVIEVTSNEVKYKKIDNLNGPLYSVVKSDLSMIRYENGTKDDFSAIKNTLDPIISDMYFKGRTDAIENYTGYKTAGTATLITTSLPFCGFMAGIVPALLCYSTFPADENLGYPDSTLMKNRTYATGYRDYANEIKKKKVLKNYFTGIPIYIVSSGIFMALVFNKGSVMF
jgi:hypothetical protein